jgi:hypothetical protein
VSWESSATLVYEGELVTDGATIEFGTAPAGLDEPSALRFTLTWRGAEAVELEAAPELWLSGSGWSWEEEPPSRLEPGESRSFALSFNPVIANVAGDWSGTLSVPVEPPLTVDLHAAVPDPLRAVIVGDGDMVLVSDDYGASWSDVSGPLTSRRARAVVWGEGRFLRAYADSTSWFAVGQYEYSEDGLTWTSAAAAEDFWPSDCAYGQGLFTCLRGGVLTWSESGGAMVHEATDWSDLLHAVHSADGRVVGVGRGGRRRLSLDAMTWTTTTSMPDGDYYNDVTFCSDRWIAVGGSHRYLISTSLDGGETWADEAWAESTYASLYTVACMGDLVLAQGANNDAPYMWRSQDRGQTWESIGGLGRWDAYVLLGVLNGWFIAQEDDDLYRSQDGLSWELVWENSAGLELRSMAAEQWP